MKKVKKAQLTLLIEYFSGFETATLRELVKHYEKKTHEENEIALSDFWNMRRIACEFVLKDRQINALF